MIQIVAIILIRLINSYVFMKILVFKPLHLW